MEPIDRIRKLRALAERSTFPAEAQASRAKADALMAKHGLTEAQVTPPQVPPHVMPPWGPRVVNFGMTNPQGPVVINIDEFMKGFMEAGGGGTFTANGSPFSAIFINGVRVK